MRRKADDRGVRKTKKALRESLGILLETKEINDISVKELTELADVNRGTFYYHYEDVHQLLKETEKELLLGFETLLASYEKAGTLESIEDLLRVVLRYISDNARLFCASLKSDKNGQFVKEIEKRLLEDWNFNIITRELNKSANPGEVAYYVHFIISGYIAVITHWLESGLSETPEAIAAMMCKVGFVRPN